MRDRIARVLSDRHATVRVSVGQQPKYALGGGEIDQVLRHVGSAATRVGAASRLSDVA